MVMEIIVFTDGSHLKPSNKCGYGIHFPNGEFEDVSRPFTKLPKTNQRAELYAIYKSIKIVNKADPNCNITINTDSEYSIKSLTVWIKNWKKNNWIGSTGKEVMNQDLIKDIDNLINKHLGKIKFNHVRAHTGKSDYNSIHNEITDELAKQGALKC
jgi:ribonuclease HI